jgi:hypothetical protein
MTRCGLEGSVVVPDGKNKRRRSMSFRTEDMKTREGRGCEVGAAQSTQP